MNILKITIILILFYNISFTNEDINFDKLFEQLNQNGITIGEDISSDDLYKLINDNNISKDKINNIVSQISNMLNRSLQNKQKIINELKQNKNSSINKELLDYLDTNTSALQNIEQSLLNEDNNISNSKLFDYLKSILN